MVSFAASSSALEKAKRWELAFQVAEQLQVRLEVGKAVEIDPSSFRLVIRLFFGCSKKFFFAPQKESSLLKEGDACLFVCLFVCLFFSRSGRLNPKQVLALQSNLVFRGSLVSACEKDLLCAVVGRSVGSIPSS